MAAAARPPYAEPLFDDAAPVNVAIPPVEETVRLAVVFVDAVPTTPTVPTDPPGVVAGGAPAVAVSTGGSAQEPLPSQTGVTVATTVVTAGTRPTTPEDPETVTVSN